MTPATAPALLLENGDLLIRMDGSERVISADDPSREKWLAALKHNNRPVAVFVPPTDAGARRAQLTTRFLALATSFAGLAFVAVGALH